MKSCFKIITLSLFMLTAGTSAVCAQSSQPLHVHVTSYKAAVSEFSARLYKMATDKMREESYFVSYDTKVSLQTFINTGVSKMFSEGLTEEKYLHQAEEAILRFAGAMINDAQKRGVIRVLDIVTFRTARTICCPGWPFC